MTSFVDIFDQINNAVIDLQSANLQSYERPLKSLGRLLRHPELKAANETLSKDLDLQTFLSRSAETRGSMVGSARLAWPDDHEQTLGLTLLLVEKFADNPDYLVQFGHSYFYSGVKIIGDIRAVTQQLIIPFVRDYKTYVMNHGKVQPRLTGARSNKIFIVHGHDGEARETVARFLEGMGFKAIILHEQANRGQTIIEKVEAHSDVSFAVVLLTPDDEGRSNGAKLEPRARQNVLLELGYFIGRLGRENVCTLKRGELEIPSDFAGVVWQSMDPAGAWKQGLCRELAAAGHQIDWNKFAS
ncbi:MAG: nucleotide-binding protein [Hyphomicrobium sp.]|uniref:TIR domain-containing protein n=1 Tax=Hyphomicrobium sp. TaxID=82 RepID=UPI0013271A29|nr:MAG: nucleotide-binding protein [Hyphomicrobium sp.]MBZ0210669.1 nucleotide-binding protein [Hyphomicrobium sp.]